MESRRQHGENLRNIGLGASHRYGGAVGAMGDGTITNEQLLTLMSELRDFKLNKGEKMQHFFNRFHDTINRLTYAYQRPPPSNSSTTCFVRFPGVSLSLTCSSQGSQ